jgi:arylsulfatase A-like enzyme
MRITHGLPAITGALLALSASFLWAADALPKPDTPFQGKIDPSRDKSKPDWPQRPTAPKGAPNVILILLDDVGFGATSTFGGPVATPFLGQLAASGLRYNRFHVNAMCPPTRGALLSGRNNHEVGFGVITESAAGYPGYNSVWPRSAASVAEVLRLNGYSTAAFDKWHNTPVWEVNPAGPFDHWPTGLGFAFPLDTALTSEAAGGREIGE